MIFRADFFQMAWAGWAKKNHWTNRQGVDFHPTLQHSSPPWSRMEFFLLDEIFPHFFFSEEKKDNKGKFQAGIFGTFGGMEDYVQIPHESRWG